MKQRKLKYSEIKAEREIRYAQQEGVCYLCGEAMDHNHSNSLVRPVLDHCHHTGRVRAVIHGDCNVLLGKVENFTTYKGKSMSIRLEQALLGMYAYMSADYSSEPFHPKHKTADEKITRAKLKKYRRLLKNSKRATTKAKYIQLIAELK